jgi:hypothetical protein
MYFFGDRVSLRGEATNYRHTVAKEGHSLVTTWIEKRKAQSQ